MDIVQAIREDRDKGAQMLEDEFKTRLMGVACRLCDDQSEAEHLVFQAFDVAIRCIESLAKKEAIYSWLCSILVKCHAKSIRRKEHENVSYMDELPDNGVDGAEQVVAAVDAGILREAIERLPPEMREAVVLHYFMDVPLLKIAKILMLPVGTVKSRLHYARVLLGQRLGASLRKPAAVFAALVALGLSAATVWLGISALGGPDVPDAGNMATDTQEEGAFYSPIEAEDASGTDPDMNADMPPVSPPADAVPSVFSDFPVLSTDNQGGTIMDKQTSNRMGRVIAKTLTAAALALGTAPAAGLTTNVWQGASGGQWGVPANWSLNRLPTTSDYVMFPDTGSDYTINVEGDYECGTFYVDYRQSGQNSVVSLTLTGGGSVTATWAAGSPNQHVARSNRKLVLDGVSLALNGNILLLYTELELKNDASYASDNGIYLWQRGTRVTVGHGCGLNLSGDVWFNGDSGVIDVEGEFRCSGVRMYNGVDHPYTLSVADGTFAVGGHGFSLPDASTLNLNGGTVQVSDSLASTKARLVRESNGTAVETLFSYNNPAVLSACAAVDVLVTNETMVLSAPFSSPNGAFALREGSVLESEYPLTVKQFFNEPGIMHAATLRIKTIVFGGGVPFSCVNPEVGAKRYVNIEGPTTIRAFADMVKPGHGFYPMVSGTVTVDTRDWNDPSVQRKMYLGLGTCTSADLVFMGGGEVGFYQPLPYRAAFSSITVSNDTTLVLSDQGVSRVRAERFTLGPNAVLKIPAGTNTVYAGQWSIDPTARIEVVVPGGFTAGAHSLLSDDSGSSLAGHTSQVTISGDGAAGWSVSHQGGALAIVKSAGTVDGMYAYEWTGGAGNANFSEADNWYCRTRPPEKQIHAFGTADTVIEPWFDKVWNGDSPGGNVGTILFRNTAVKSFTICGTERNLTCESTTAYWSRQVPNANTISSWGVYSQSALPQIIAASTLRSGTLLSVAAGGFGPVVVNSDIIAGSESYGDMHVGGDVRFVKSGLSIPRLVIQSLGGGDAGFGSRLTLLSGASLTVLRQDGVVTYGTTGAMFANGASFNVEEGAILSFAAGSGAEYKWTCSQPGKSVINGTLNVLAPYVSAANVVYGGTGRINVSEFRCSSAAGSLGLAGTVNLYPPAAWNTVDSYGANTPFVLMVYESPTIHLSGDWTYGPAAAVAGTTTTAAADRACVVAKGATLTIDCGGHVATFADPVGGSGTLAVTNGTLRMAGGNDETLSLAVGNGGVFAWNDAVTVASLSLDPAATLHSGLSAPLTVNGSIALGGVHLAADPIVFKKKSGWQTLLVANGGTISGPVQHPSAWRTRLATTESGQTLQAYYFHGMSVSIR